MNSTCLNKRPPRDAAASVVRQRLLFQVALLVAALGFLVLIS